ncbi:hypothetical protein Y1Q_0004864 [Alligator mississippiensis]|uniref:Uncharacterized protein n=1 Tax=Alligator mississippiensis TaxID=8496 RepID=A0A151NRY9_ALLMI|nr:hypothetical protein Y1Q_0004864 [Alligator mississippiensis]
MLEENEGNPTTPGKGELENPGQLLLSSLILLYLLLAVHPWIKDNALQLLQSLGGFIRTRSYRFTKPSLTSAESLS